MKNKNNYKFVMGILGGVVLIIQSFTYIFDFSFTDDVANTFINIVAGILLALGVVKKPATIDDEVAHEEEVLDSEIDKEKEVLDSEFDFGKEDKEDN